MAHDTPNTPTFSRIFRRIAQRHPLVWIFLGLLLVILVLGILICVKRCSHSLSASSYATPELAPLEACSRLDSIVLRSQSKVYGLPVDKYEIERGEIESGETFSRLLNQRYDVNIKIVNRLIALSKGKFELRDIRAGHTYTAFLTPDSTQALCYLVYERNQKDYVTFALCDSVYVRVDKKEVASEERYVEGVINSSLSATIYEHKLPVDLAQRMAQIYQSVIDFFALQKGDKFRVLYEEEYIDTTCIGVGNIYGVEFIHAGKSYWAYRFQQDNEWGYWDDKGVNLKQAMLKAPLSFSARITSRFGKRIHPIKRIRRQHNGVDYACPVGTPVHAVASGVVTKRGWDPFGGGNRIWIKHAQGYESAYLHLSRFAVKQGQRVSQGQVIAYSGNTGGSTGPHLDYRLKKNGKYINPLTNTSQPSTPIKAGNKAAFEQVKTDVRKVMESYASDR
ncbi:M23 family metallopeptidase [uncultured Rikenella sp.]|uniref:M23 family metallopeptidase n=1 Tax=uncultured Rikenella sp. TaxID=368003 RepID=UPI00262B9E72|nr:M23 family metallopeptidase [uncultured Rikenella sp.]